MFHQCQLDTLEDMFPDLAVPIYMALFAEHNVRLYGV